MTDDYTTCYDLRVRPFMPADLPAASSDAAETFIQRCLQGHQLAWDVIVRPHWRKVFNVAYKFVGWHEEAEDFTQEIFLTIFAQNLRPARDFSDVADERQPGICASITD